jgi:hypothetical protein
LLLVVVTLVVATGFLVTAYAPVKDDDIAALHVLSGVPGGGSARVDRLFATYLARARRYRTSWSVVAWLSGIVLALGLTTGGYSGGGPDPTPLVLLGFSGYLLGAIAGELHHLRRPKHGSRTASLTPRRLRDFMSTRERWFVRVLAFLVFALAAVGVAIQATASGSYGPPDPNGRRDLLEPVHEVWLPLLVLAAIAAVVWLVIELAQRAIVERPRPALPDDLAEGDDVIRRASLSTVSLGGSGLVALIASAEAAFLARNVRNQGALLCLVAVLVLFGLAIGLMFRTRRVVWPQRKLEKDGGIW